MKSSQLIKIDSISSGDSDKKKNCRRAIIKRCTGAVEAFWKRKANPNRILYVKRIVRTHKEIHTSHIIVKNGGNGSNTLFQFTHTPKKKRFFSSFRKPVHFILYSYMKLHTFTHTLWALREKRKRHALYTVQYHSFSHTVYWPSKWNKKKRKIPNKKMLSAKKTLRSSKRERYESEKCSRDFCMFSYLVPHKIVKPSDSDAKKTRLYVYSHTRPCMREYVQQIDCGGGATGPKISL